MFKPVLDLTPAEFITAIVTETAVFAGTAQFVRRAWQMSSTLRAWMLRMDSVPVAAVCARLGLAGAPIHRFPDGSLPVYAVGDHLVLKFYPDEDVDEARTEIAVLRALECRLSVPTPAVEAVGELDAWRYLLMRRLHGVTLQRAWPRLSAHDRAALAPRLGSLLAEIHAVSAVGLTDVEPGDWTGFLAQRRAAAVSQQQRLGLHADWLDQIPGFLDSVDLGAPAPVLLHTEFMPEHVFIRPDCGRWMITGIIDFEPAMNGAPEYDFVAAGIFVAGGDPVFWQRMLRGYGYASAEVDEEFARRCLAYTLLHRYSNLNAYLERMPPPPRPTLDSLALTWFGTGA